MATIILGLDPGTVRTGFAVVTKDKNKFSLLEMGILSVESKKSLEQKIFIIGRGLEKLYQKYDIENTAIEQIFLGKNPNSCFKLAQIVGVCMYQAMNANSQVFSYATRYVKKSITGFGSADKEAVKVFVLNFFNIQKMQIKEDATDALALALCHAYQLQNSHLFKEIGSNK